MNWFVFQNMRAVVSALLVILSYARKSKDEFEFGPLSLKDLRESGMWIRGDVEGVSAQVSRVDGVVLQERSGR